MFKHLPLLKEGERGALPLSKVLSPSPSKFKGGSKGVRLINNPLPLNKGMG